MRFVTLTGVFIVLFAISLAKRHRIALREREPCEQEGYYPSEEDCTKFYRCAGHDTEDGRVYQKFEFKCAPGTIYDDTISSCNHPSNVNDKPEGCKAEEGEPDTDYPENVESTSSTTTTTMSPNENKNQVENNLITQPAYTFVYPSWFYSTRYSQQIPTGYVYLI